MGCPSGGIAPDPTEVHRFFDAISKGITEQSAPIAIPWTGTDILTEIVPFRVVDDRRLWAEEETLFLFRVFLTESAGSCRSVPPG